MYDYYLYDAKIKLMNHFQECVASQDKHDLLIFIEEKQCRGYNSEKKMRTNLAINNFNCTELYRINSGINYLGCAKKQSYILICIPNQQPNHKAYYWIINFFIHFKLLLLHYYYLKIFFTRSF